MNIIMSGDSRMYDGFELVIYSTMAHNTNVHWYILTMSITCPIGGTITEFNALTKEQMEKLARIVNYFDKNSSICFVDMYELYRNTIFDNPNREAGFTPFATLRLLVDLALPELDDALYLDSDIAVQQNLQHMYDYYLSKNVEYCAYSIPDACQWEGEMISGVLVLNLKRIRETEFLAKARINLVDNEYLYPDQMALRDAGKPYPLDETYNYMHDLWKCDYKPAIIHFSNELLVKIYTDDSKAKFYRTYPCFNYVQEGVDLINSINMEGKYEYFVWGR